MDNMLEENKNLKDSIKDTKNMPAPYQTAGLGSGSVMLPYNKTNKLISALYIVTDIMDKEEPLRSKLREAGANIISDIYSISKTSFDTSKINNRISEILSFLEVAFSVGIISEMNSNILIKEFVALRQSVIENNTKNEENWLEEFIGEEFSLPLNSPHPTHLLSKERGDKYSKGQTGTRIGVQKGSTLLQALSRVKMSDRISNPLKSQSKTSEVKNGNFDVLKDKRHQEIILIIKDKMKNSLNFDGITITDIKNEAKNLPTGEIGVLASCGEKTLQRELVSMVLKGVLTKTGSKRWSRYSLK